MVHNCVPNQRAKNKIYLGGFVDRRFHQEIVRQAKAAGMADNKFGFVTRLLQEALEHRRPRRKPAPRRARPARRRVDVARR